jgi:hypothetical protein
MRRFESSRPSQCNGALVMKASLLDPIEPARLVNSRGLDANRIGSSRLAWRRLNLIDEKTARIIRQIRLHPKLAFWMFACVLILLVWQRCPTAISQAEFWAEDGWVWYPQCYAMGWRCLVIDHSAYLQTISRLVALLSLLWPLAAAPRVFALAALLMQAAPAIFLVSARMTPAIPSLRVRMALALLLVAIPGMSEVYVNLTNGQWHLALLAFLILTAAPAVTWPQRMFDTLVLLVSGLSGPFSPVLLPVAILWCWRQPGRWQIWRLAIILVTAGMQVYLVFFHQSTRAAGLYGVGWSFHRLLNIVDTNILGVAAFGFQAMTLHDWVVGKGWLSNSQLLPTLIAGCIMAGAFALAIIGCLRGPWILRAYILFVALELVASLVDGIAPGMSTWEAMERDIGMRYFFHPIAAWLAIMVTLVCDRSLPLRAIGIAIMALAVTVAIPADWELPPPEHTLFHHEAKLFDRAGPGTVMTFPVRPAFLHTDMVLVKH